MQLCPIVARVLFFTACLEMHAETKAELLALKSEMQAQMQAQTLALKSEVRKIKAEAQEESLALKSETQALKTELHQMKTTMGSKFASIEKALMHGKNKTWSDNHKALFWMGWHSCQFCLSCFRDRRTTCIFQLCIVLTSRDSVKLTYMYMSDIPGSLRNLRILAIWQYPCATFRNATIIIFV